MKVDVIYQTDALSGLKLLADESIDCIVTSPPYWQLRDYGVEPLLWCEDKECSHDFDKWNICQICGAWIGELGQEPTREKYIGNLISIFDECYRVLKKEDTLWVNLGDTYNTPNKNTHHFRHY